MVKKELRFDIAGQTVVINWYAVIIFITAVLSLAFLLWRAKFGFCFNDEPFCVTLAQRLYQGDALIVDEWHGTQLFSAVLLPFYAVFRLFSPDNEGILLVFRYVYCILWWITCLTLCLRLSKHYKSALLCFVYLILFSPLDYMTLSYTSIGLMSSLFISYIIYYVSQHEERPKLSIAVIYSVLWVLLVLSSPFMAIAYVGLFFLAFIGNFINKNKTVSFFKNMLSLYKFSIPIVCFAAFLFLFFFVFSRTDISKVVKNFPFILSDPEHKSINFIGSIKKTIMDFYLNYPAYMIASAVFFSCGLIFKSKLRQIRGLMFFIVAGMFIYGQYEYLKSNLYPFNFQMAYVVVLGAVAFSLLNQKNYALFLSFYGFSFAYLLFNGVASNTGVMATSMAMTVAGVVGIIFIAQFMYELYEQYCHLPLLRIASVAIVCAVLLFQGYSELYVRMHRQYWDSPLPKLNHEIQCGAAKGLITTDYQAAEYETIHENLSHLINMIDTNGKRFLSCTSAPYVYIDADLEFATFSAWTFGYNGTLNERILQYQSVNPNQVPDLVFCASKDDILPFIDNSYMSYSYNGSYLFVKK